MGCPICIRGDYCPQKLFDIWRAILLRPASRMVINRNLMDKRRVNWFGQFYLDDWEGMVMAIDFSEFMLLVAGGVALSASFSIIHFSSTLNRFNRSLAIFVPIILCGASIYTTMMLSDTGPASSFSDSIASSIVSLVSLFPIFAAVLTIALFRITLLTNRPVGASSQ